MLPLDLTLGWSRIRVHSLHHRAMAATPVYYQQATPITLPLGAVSIHRHVGFEPLQRARNFGTAAPRRVAATVEQRKRTHQFSTIFRFVSSRRSLSFRDLAQTSDFFPLRSSCHARSSSLLLTKQAGQRNTYDACIEPLLPFSFERLYSLLSTKRRFVEV